MVRRKVDDTLVGDRAVARPAADGEGVFAGFGFPLAVGIPDGKVGSFQMELHGPRFAGFKVDAGETFQRLYRCGDAGGFLMDVKLGHFIAGARAEFEAMLAEFEKSRG